MGRGLRAVCNCANTGDIGDTGDWIWLHLRRGNRQLSYIDGEISAGIIAVEEVEELRERIYLPALADLERARDAQVHLDVRRAAEFIEAGGLSIDINAVGIVAG